MSENGEPRGGIFDTLKRVGLYTARRTLVLSITFTIGVYLAILIANMGGELDAIRRAQISETVIGQIMADATLQALSADERKYLIEQRVALEVDRLGLNRPFISRSIDHLIRAITFHLGRAEHMTSDSGSREVSRIIIERLPATVLLFATANLLVFFATLFAALFLSRRYGSLADRAVIGMTPLNSAPSWFYGIFLILIFAFVLPWFPPGGMVSAPPPEGRWEYAGSVALHMILPVAAMFISSVFISTYSWRTFFLIYSSEDYVEMAKAKGLSSGAIERRYILRPTLPPILTSFAFMLITLWTGSIILERIFEWPGMGSMLFMAIGHADTPVIVGGVVIYAFMLVLTVFILDIAYAVLDPRVKLGGGAQ